MLGRLQACRRADCADGVTAIRARYCLYWFWMRGAREWSRKQRRRCSNKRAARKPSWSHDFDIHPPQVLSVAVLLISRAVHSATLSFPHHSKSWDSWESLHQPAQFGNSTVLFFANSCLEHGILALISPSLFLLLLLPTYLFFCSPFRRRLICGLQTSGQHGGLAAAALISQSFAASASWHFTFLLSILLDRDPRDWPSSSRRIVILRPEYCFRTSSNPR